jgi:beta-lactamase superfamily II metal-dependent hydrolase
MPKLKPPKNGVTVRMYRQGHGDCFLLAMPREGGGNPVYVLIDCGYKPGSPAFIPGEARTIGDIVNDLGEATGFHLDLAIITHEHQDHLNGIWKANSPYFEDFEIEEAWMAWTEDPDDELANELRKRHKDQLLSLVQARRKLALAVGEDHLSVERVDSFLSLEFGGEDEKVAVATLLAAAEDPTKSVNKQGLKLIKDKASQNQGVSYLSPGGKPLVVPGTGIRAFVLGPPRDEDLLVDEDPHAGEGFPEGGSSGFTFRAAAASETGTRRAPFNSRFCLPMSAGLSASHPDPFFREHYGQGEEGKNDANQNEVPPNAPWRRIDSEWLYSAEELALKLNTGINNTSLVLAFELPESKKILFFAGDAQRGNWISWSDVEWDQVEEAISTRDLLARTVLYKVGHHGSHNATLKGKVDDEYANLSWMATGTAAGEFAAMITAVNEWAMTKNNPPWRHPLPSIKKALSLKAHGRVFQTDVGEPEKPDGVSDASWNAFVANCTFEKLYFDYVVLDE